MWLPHFSARAGNLVPCQHPADKVQQHLTIAFSFGGISIPVEAVTPYRHKNKNAVLTQNINLSQAKTRGWVKANKKSLHPWPSKIHKIIMGPSIPIFHSLQQKAGTVYLNMIFPFPPTSWQLLVTQNCKWATYNCLWEKNNEVYTKCIWQSRTVFLKYHLWIKTLWVFLAMFVFTTLLSW